jgi:hypothetical protein
MQPFSGVWQQCTQIPLEVLHADANDIYAFRRNLSTLRFVYVAAYAPFPTEQIVLPAASFTSLVFTRQNEGLAELFAIAGAAPPARSATVAAARMPAAALFFIEPSIYILL